MVASFVRVVHVNDETGEKFDQEGQRDLMAWERKDQERGDFLFGKV